MGYAFETITAEEARNFGVADSLTFRNASARDVQVVYQSVDPLSLTPEVPSILLTVSGRTVAFNTNIIEASRIGGVLFENGTQLHLGGTSNDVRVGGGHDDALYGAFGDDNLQGAGGDDHIEGGVGNDFIHGNQGDDELFGGAGADWIYGGQGNDVIWAGAGDESGPVRLWEGSGRDAGDWAHGNLGDDEIHGSYGKDTLYGGQGNDTILGGDGDDLILGDGGDDLLFGGLGVDNIFGGDGDDRLEGGMGGDFLNGGAGQDFLRSNGPESSYLEGGEGSDTLVAAASGSDVMEGGEGRDQFHVLVSGDTRREEADVILDWESSDKLFFFDVTTMGIEPAEGHGPVGLAAPDEMTILPMSYSEFVAGSYEEALRTANDHIAHAQAKWVVAQVGEDCYVFADNGDPADGADVVVRLWHTDLSEIGLSNFSLV